MVMSDGRYNFWQLGNRGTTRTPRECTYKDFLNCHPLNFKGTEGVVVLAQWFEKMESVFHISNCAMKNQVKFATCTFVRNALTWWNSHMKAVTQDVAYAMDWKTLKKMMTTKYYPRELALICGRMFFEKSDEVEKYVGGLPDMIWGNVMQAEQKRKLEYNAGKQIRGHNNKTRGRTLGGLTLLGLVKRESTRDHCPCVQNTTITTNGHVLPDVINARRSAIWLVTVGVLVPMQRIQAALDQQKSYADLKQKPMEFEVGDRVIAQLQFLEEPVEIIEREIKRLKRSRIPLVKVRWNSRRGPEFTWEREDSFKQKYPQLFTNQASSSTTRS
ncbi:hypothetical protein Tco_0991673 [Tanacetum coccineum]|uniref:Reverse transcriptase domain-containing protein n=1 Tax=Tanacetum coccineum TaxID=301880 RepID=A0ABQ5F0P6_9ASTR